MKRITSLLAAVVIPAGTVAFMASLHRPGLGSPNLRHKKFPPDTATGS